MNAALPRLRKRLCSGREETSDRKKHRCGSGSWYPPLCPNVNARLCVEEQLFRADVEERLFRAVSACAFDCGLQPRPALKGIHPPAVAPMNGRSSTLTQALVLRARRNTPTGRNPGAAQVRRNHPCVSNTWRNKEMGQPQSVPAPEKMG